MYFEQSGYILKYAMPEYWILIIFGIYFHNGRGFEFCWETVLIYVYVYFKQLVYRGSSGTIHWMNELDVDFDSFLIFEFLNSFNYRI